MNHRELLASSFVTDNEGVQRALHSNTSLEQCAFLQRVIHRIDARKCLELGLAYGVSSLAICESISGKQGASLISIDPFQRASWNDIGLLNLDRGGFSGIVEFHANSSHQVLPELLKAGCSLDFAYVDTSKVFDVLFVDAFFIVRLLRLGGVVAFDDCKWPGVRALVRYLVTLPHLEVFDTHGQVGSSSLRQIGSAMTRTVPMKERIFRNELVQTDEKLGVAASCVAIRKISEDERPWDWSLHP